MSKSEKVSNQLSYTKSVCDPTAKLSTSSAEKHQEKRQEMRKIVRASTRESETVEQAFHNNASEAKQHRVNNCDITAYDNQEKSLSGKEASVIVR